MADDVDKVVGRLTCGGKCGLIGRIFLGNSEVGATDYQLGLLVVLNLHRNEAFLAEIGLITVQRGVQELLRVARTVAIFLKFLLFLAKICFGPAIWPQQLSEIAVTLVRLEEQVLPNLVDAQSGQQRVHVQDSSMHADLTTLAQRLLSRTEEPLAELNSALFVLNL